MSAGNENVETWAGVAFLPLYLHDGRMIRAPGLFGFVRRDTGGCRELLFVDHADWIAGAATVGHPAWSGALRLGMNEVHVCLAAQARADRLQLVAHLARHLRPPLNPRRGHRADADATTPDRIAVGCRQSA